MDKTGEAVLTAVVALALGVGLTAVSNRRTDQVQLGCTRVDGEKAVGYTPGQIAVSYLITRHGLRNILSAHHRQRFRNGVDAARYYLDLAEEVVLARGGKDARTQKRINHKWRKQHEQDENAGKA